MKKSNTKITDIYIEDTPPVLYSTYHKVKVQRQRDKNRDGEGGGWYPVPPPFTALIMPLTFNVFSP